MSPVWSASVASSAHPCGRPPPEPSEPSRTISATSRLPPLLPLLWERRCSHTSPTAAEGLCVPTLAPWKLPRAYVPLCALSGHGGGGRTRLSQDLTGLFVY